ncbi:hypothetical protein AVEN_215731-1 [Araneus ventricosus]|uniref:Uncharacterized protein n=1 Tax=Araneus ventricosus TaxID=182803 RepID=A0A4Y2FPI3_ARAVE|nr:hypothetical protein AVEN_215731-1 [Araneus ventricosus]
MTRTTPELAPPSPNFRATPTGGRLATTYDLACNRPHTRRIFSGIGFRTCDPPEKKRSISIKTALVKIHTEIADKFQLSAQRFLISSPACLLLKLQLPLLRRNETMGCGLRRGPRGHVPPVDKTLDMNTLRFYRSAMILRIKSGEAGRSSVGSSGRWNEQKGVKPV